MWYKLSQQYCATGIAVFLSLAFTFLCIEFRNDQIASIPAAPSLGLWAGGWLCWIYLAYFNRFRCSRPNLMMLAVLIYAAGNVLLQAKSDSKSINLLLHLFSLTGMFYFFVETYARFQSIYLIGIAASLVIQVCIGLSQVWTNGFEQLSLTGSFNNSGSYANYALAGLPFICSGLLLPRFTKPTRLLLLLLTMLLCFLILLTRSRAAITGVLVGSCILLLGSFYLKRTIGKKGFIWLTCSALAIVFFISFSSYSFKPDSAQGRITIYKVCLNIIRDHPWTGIGPGRFPAVYNNYQSEYFRNSNVPIKTQPLATDTFEAFNWVLQVLAEYGVFGLVLLSVLLWKVYQGFLKQAYTMVELGALASFSAVLYAGLFSNPFHLIGINLLMVFYLSVFAAKRKGDFVVSRELQPKYRLLLLPVICIASFVYGREIYLKLNALKKWGLIQQEALYEAPGKSLYAYQDLLPTLATNGHFLFNYGAEACIAGDFGTSIKMLERAKDYHSSSNLYSYLGDAYLKTHGYKEAERAYLTCTYMVPSLLYPKHQLVELYLRMADTSRAIVVAENALAYPVKIKSTYTNRLRADIKRRLKELKGD